MSSVGGAMGTPGRYVNTQTDRMGGDSKNLYKVIKGHFRIKSQSDQLKQNKNFGGGFISF